MTVDRDRLVAALSPAVSRAGYDLEDLEVAGAGKRTVLRVVVDRDGGFGLDDVADLSRDVSAVLDEADDLLPGAYVLEVSSPGVDRPLTLPRHWRRNRDRLVKVRLTDGQSVTGRVQTAGQRSVVLDVDGTSREIEFDTVGLAKVQIELRPRRGASSTGADDAQLDDDHDDHDDIEDLDLDDDDVEDNDLEDNDLEDNDLGDSDLDDGEDLAEDADLTASELDGSKLDQHTAER